MFGWLFGSRAQGVMERGKAGAVLARDALIGLVALAVEGIWFALATTTAIAAGFVSALGLDSMALMGKWAIVSAVLFYTSTLWALMSPLMALPRSMGAFAQRSSQMGDLKAKEDDAKRAALDKARLDLSAASSIRPNWLRLTSEIESEDALRDACAKLEKQGADEKWATLPPDSVAPYRRTANMLNKLSYAMYASVLALLVVWTVGVLAGVIIDIALLALFWLSRKVGMAPVFPLASVLLLFYGHQLGRVILDLEPTATIASKDAREREIKARVLLTTAEDILIVQHMGNERLLSMLPKSTIARISVRAVPVSLPWPQLRFGRWP